MLNNWNVSVVKYVLESCVVNPRWTNLILHGINGNTGGRRWEIKVHKERRKSLI